MIRGDSYRLRKMAVQHVPKDVPQGLKPS